MGVTESEIPQMYPKMAPYLTTKGPEYQEWMFGSEVKNIPHWTGYTIGFYIVKNYIDQHPNLSWNELIQVNKSEFQKTWEEALISKNR